MPSGVWRAAPSSSVPTSCVVASPICSKAWLTRSFIMCSWLEGSSATRVARRSAAASTSAAGTASEASPQSTARRPSMASPVSSSRFERSSPTRYIHIAVVGEPHTRAGGYPMRQSSLQTMRSLQSARSVPPATQKPWTWATTGFGERHRAMYASTKRDIVR
jgi:hypothetical protein